MSAGIRRLDFRTFGVASAEGTPVPDLDEAALLDEVVDHLRGGGVIGYPTETVYGFGSALSPQGLQRLRGLKRRPDGKPVLALVEGADSVAELGWTEAARELARAFWPGAVTLILPDPAECFPAGVRGDDGTVAIRQTSHPLAAALVKGLGAPLTSTSANLPGQPPATDGAAVIQTLIDSGPAGQGVWVMDAGPLQASAPSTLIDCSSEPPRVVRAGATPVDRIRCVIPELMDASTNV